MMSRDIHCMYHVEKWHGPFSDMKNRAKAILNNGAMSFIRSNEDALRKESLAEKLLCKNDKAFWKEMNNSNLSYNDDMSRQYKIIYAQHN